MPGPSLAGARVVVIGASAGIGRAVADRAARDGARLVLGARRADVLKETAAAAAGATPVAVDVRDPAACARLADEVAATLGQADLVLVSVGLAPLTRFAATTPAEWHSALDTNLVGIHQVISALLPVLAPGAIVAALSSEVVGMPRQGLGVYGATKAAMEHALETFRVEHPGVRFSTVVVGATVPTEFANAFTDVDLLLEALDDWGVHGLSTADMMDTGQVADVLVGMLASALPYPGVGVERLLLRTPSAVVGSPQAMKDKFEEAAGDTAGSGD